MAKKALKVVIPSAPTKLDLGCGTRKKDGFIGVDRRKFDNVDVVADLKDKWPWKDDTVEEVHMSHVLEHFTGLERVHIMNELYRILQKGAKALIITPHWCSNRAYGDFTHQWPPVSEMYYYYLSKTWRADNAPDNDSRWNPEGYNCDFEATWGYTGGHSLLNGRSQEAIQWMTSFYKEAVMDMQATLVKK
jgi:methyltransferase family protein